MTTDEPEPQPVRLQHNQDAARTMPRLTNLPPCRIVIINMTKSSQARYRNVAFCVDAQFVEYRLYLVQDAFGGVN